MNEQVKKFEFTDSGYIKARQYLSAIGELEKDHAKYFAMNGIQIIAEANAILSKQIILTE